MIRSFGWINLSLGYQEEKMPHRINEECINCGACEPECPVEAISEEDPIYVIDESVCVDCEGHFDSPRCIEYCPVDCIDLVE